MEKEIVKLNNEEYNFYRTENDTYGNPRYIIHFLDLGLTKYENIKGLKKYKGKNFGGGYVVQSYNLEDTLKHILTLLN